jgi:hypothetical protein
VPPDGKRLSELSKNEARLDHVERAELTSLRSAESAFRDMQILTMPLLKQFMGEKTYPDVMPGGQRGDAQQQIKRFLDGCKRFLMSMSAKPLMKLNDAQKKVFEQLRSDMKGKLAEVDKLSNDFDAILSGYREEVWNKIQEPDYNAMEQAEEERKHLSKYKRSMQDAAIGRNVFGSGDEQTTEPSGLDVFLSKLDSLISEISGMAAAADSGLASVSAAAAPKLTRLAEHVEVSDMYASYDMSSNCIEQVDNKLIISNKIKSLIPGKGDLGLTAKYAAGESVCIDLGDSIINGSVVAYLGSKMYRVSILGAERSVSESNIFKGI